MSTKYDVFAKIIEKAPCKSKDLGFAKPVYAHIDLLVRENWVRKTKGVLVPIKNEKTIKIFKIISWSLKNNIDYNIFFSENVGKILKVISETSPVLNPKELAGNKTNNEIIDFFEENQFILSWKRKPKNGTLLNHSIFELVIGKKVKERFLLFNEINDKVLSLAREELNPFDKKVFEFLAGSAQLEGSTVSIGETVDLILKSIYPDKSAEDIQMVKNLNAALTYVFENVGEELTLEHLKEINKICLFSLHKGAGMFKKTQNKILGNPDFKTTLPSQVVSELEKFCDVFNKIKTREECLEKLGFIHNQHQRIHPFVDGNSRTTRLLVNWLLMKHGFPILILKVGSFEKYMGLTKLSGKRDDLLLRNFMLHVIYHEEILKD